MGVLVVDGRLADVAVLQIVLLALDLPCERRLLQLTEVAELANQLLLLRLARVGVFSAKLPDYHSMSWQSTDGRSICVSAAYLPSSSLNRKADPFTQCLLASIFSMVLMCFMRIVS